MTISDQLHKNIPEYYRYMYLDGYAPEQILYAARRKMLSAYAECMDEQNQIDNIKIVSEVKIK